MSSGSFRFEPGAALAWMVDIDSGYRQATHVEWEIRPMAELPGGKASLTGAQKISVGQVIGGELEGIDLRVEPAAEGQIKVSSNEPLSSMAYGDTSPRSAKDSVEVPYGSVVRVGPVLVAPLYGEQAESVRQGNMTLPKIGAALTAPTEKSEGVAEGTFTRSRLPLILVLAFLALAAAGVVAYLLWPRLDPRTVVVAMTGWPSEQSEALREAFQTRLEDAGLVPVLLPADLELGEDADVRDLEPMAREHLAAHAILYRGEIVESREGLGQGSRFQIAAATIQWWTLEHGQSSEPLKLFSISEFGTDEGALTRVVQQRTSELVDRALFSIIESPPVLEFLQSPDISEREDAGRLADLRKIGASVTTTRERFGRSCEKTAREVREDSGALELHCVSQGCAEEYALGLTGDGKALIVQVESDRPVVTRDAPVSVRRGHLPERIDVVPVKGGERRTLATALDFFSIGSVSDDGSTVYAVERSHDFYGLIAIEVESGDRRVLKTLPAPERFYFPKSSSDERFVAFTHRVHDSRREKSYAWIMEIENGRLLELDRGISRIQWVELAWPEEEDSARTRPRQLLAEVLISQHALRGYSVPFTDERREEAASDPRIRRPLKHVVLIEPEQGEAVARIGGLDRIVSRVIGVREGELLVIDDTRVDECALGRFDPRTGETSWTPLSTCLVEASITGDGSVVGIARARREGDESGRDDEVVLVDPSTGQVTALTANSMRDRYPRTSVGTAAFAFERLPGSPYRSLPRVSVCAARVE